MLEIYRRDQIDSSHYPVFHQMEGLRIFPSNVQCFSFTKDASIQDTSTMNSSVNPLQPVHSPEQAQAVAAHLKHTLEHFVRALFHPNIPIRWIDAYFPFTAPSFEMEIYHNGQWLEVLGCGVIQQEIMTHAGLGHQLGWAFGLGLDRLAMVLYQIPDIRLFWSQDPRFVSQFKEGKVSLFRPFSKYPLCYKDVSFWCREGQSFLENDMFDVVRDVAGDVAEQVKLLDRYQSPKTRLESQCYRIEYRSMDRTLTNEEVDNIQNRVRERLVEQYGVSLR
jgi:phenylalanyl-tRNA synthetase alpha chain